LLRTSTGVEFTAAKSSGLAGHFPGFIAGFLIRAWGSSFHAAHDLPNLRTKQIVFAVFGSGEFFHAIHGAVKALYGFDPQGASYGVVFENVVRDVIRQDTSPMKSTG
jgi:hypothetical protein